MNTFFSRLILFSLIVGVADFAWNNFLPDKTIPEVVFILTFFIASTYIFHQLSLSYSKKKPQAFIRFYMASTMIRMVLYVCIIAIYRLIDKSSVVSFTIGFFAHYIVFTIFEIPMLLKQLKSTPSE